MCNTRYCILGRQLMLAAGDSGGTLHILEVPWSLSHASGNEVTGWMYVYVMVVWCTKVCIYVCCYSVIIE